MRRFIVTLALLSLLGSACGSAQQPGPAGGARSTEKTEGSESRASAAADAAPNFTVTTFDGGTFSLAEQRGTPVVLNFWESW